VARVGLAPVRVTTTASGTRAALLGSLPVTMSATVPLALSVVSSARTGVTGTYRSADVPVVK